MATELRKKELFWPDWGALAGLLISGLEVRVLLGAHVPGSAPKAHPPFRLRRNKLAESPGGCTKIED